MAWEEAEEADLAAVVAAAAGERKAHSDDRRITRMILSVASGKGGTGKTLIATSLALALEGQEPVQLLDCDVEEPNAHILLRPAITSSQPVLIPVPRIDQDRCTYCRLCSEACVFNAIAVAGKAVLLFPELCHGCGLCSHVCPQKAIAEEGREVGIIQEGTTGEIRFVHGRLAIGEAMPVPVTRAVKAQADPTAAVIIDAPPGNSCPVVEAAKGSDFCLLVTEPTPFGLHDLALAVELTKRLGVPCGVVINRDGSGDEQIEKYCAEEDVPVLLRIPLDRRIAELYCRGTTLVAGLPGWRRTFLELWESARRLAKPRRMSHAGDRRP